MGHGMVFEEKERIEQPHPRLYFSYRFAFMRVHRPSICFLTVFSSAQPQPTTHAAQPGPGTQVTYHALVAAPPASALEEMAD